MSNGKIFISIASYRDPELVPTIKDCIANASDPNNLVFGICHQYSPDDEWDNLDEFKDDKRFRILSYNYKDAKGVCWARNKIQDLYEDEQWALQIDSHHRFAKDWDKLCIRMFDDSRRAGWDKPLLTAYIPSYNPENDPEERVHEPWYLGYDRFAPEGPLHTRPHTIENHHTLKLPVPARFFSGHFAFTIGQWMKEVPYDPNLYFHGEEITMAVRSFTHGYDLLAPHQVVCWHFYGRDQNIRHWQDHDFSMRDQISFERVKMLLGVGKAKCRPCQLKQLKPYALGLIRTIYEYEKYAGIDFTKKKLQRYTLDHKLPPNPTVEEGTDYDTTLLPHQKFCVDVMKAHFHKDDYLFCVVSFEGDEPGDVIHREDMDATELNSLLNRDPNSEFIHIWREFYGPMPTKVVIWPNSKSEGYIDRYEHRYKE